MTIMSNRRIFISLTEKSLWSQVYIYQNKKRQHASIFSAIFMAELGTCHKSVATIGHCFKANKFSPVALPLNTVPILTPRGEHFSNFFCVTKAFIRYRIVACRNIKQLSRAQLLFVTWWEYCVCFFKYIY